MSKHCLVKRIIPVISIRKDSNNVNQNISDRQSLILTESIFQLYDKKPYVVQCHSNNKVKSTPDLSDGMATKSLLTTNITARIHI